MHAGNLAPASWLALGRFWRPEVGIFLAFWLFLLFAGRSRLLNDPGTLWHTLAGQRMLDSGAVLRSDPFSFTTVGQPWVAHQWLGECSMALLHRLGGLDALLLAAVTLLAGLYTWLAQRLIRAGLHWSVAALVAATALLASASGLLVRPHLATMLLLGILFACLCDVEAGRIGPGRLGWLVPLFVLWSNVHGGVVGGLGTLAITVMGWGLYRLLGWESPVTGWRRLGLLTALVVACGLTALVNPYGLDLPRTWLAIVQSSELAKHISEHGRLVLSEPEGLAVVPMALIYLAGLLTVRRRPRVVWLVPVVWLALAGTRIRHAPLFAVTASLALADLLPYTRLVRSRIGLFQLSANPAPATGWRPWLLPALLVGTAFLLPGWARLDPDRWPVDLVPELRKIEANHPDGTPIFNEYRLGGFVIYYAPGLRVFIDDRWELYGDERLRDYAYARTHDAGDRLKEWQKQWPFEFALTQTGSSFDEYFRDSPEWAVVGKTTAGRLYRRMP